MNRALLDPNNHVPEISPDDDWGDAEGFGLENPTIPTVTLPPRRTAADRVSAGVVGTETSQSGLRIESNVMRGNLTDSSQRLEVQDFTVTVVRLDQMEPMPPKVPRQVIFRERPAHEARGKKPLDESLQWGIARRRPTHWIIGAGAVVAMIVVLAMMMLPAINAPNAARPVPDAAPFVEENVDGMERMNFLLGKQPEAMRIFRSYATATQPDEIVPLLRDGNSLKETLLANWHPQKVSKSWEPASASTDWVVLDLPGNPCGLLQGTFPDQSKFAAFFTSDGNQLLVDWKATTAFGTATFAQLGSNQGDPAEIRGVISSADYYNAIFPEADYQSYRLISPDGEAAIWCYGRRGETADELIAQLLRRGEIGGDSSRSSRITLRLERGPEGALPNQWLVGEMLNLDWVTP